MGSAFHDARPASPDLLVVGSWRSLPGTFRRGSNFWRSVTARRGAAPRDAAANRTIEIAFPGLREESRLPRPGTPSTDRELHKEPLVAIRALPRGPVPPLPFRPEQFPASRLDPVRHPQPQPGTACAGQTPPADFCMSMTTREHTCKRSNLAGGARFLRPPGITRPKPLIREQCVPDRSPARRPKTSCTLVGRPSTWHARSGAEANSKPLPDTSCRRHAVIRPWSGRARGCADQGLLPPPRANERASKRPRCLRLPASSAEALPSVGNRRPTRPEG